MSDFRCPDCATTFTDEAMRESLNRCPGCGLRFGPPRVRFDAHGHLRALDAIAPGELVAVVRGSPAPEPCTREECRGVGPHKH